MIHHDFVYPGSCPRISHCQVIWLGWKPSPKVIWCQKPKTRRQWPNFGCNSHYQDNGTIFVHHCVSIAHRIQIVCVMLVIARTKVWITFFWIFNRIIIQQHGNNKHDYNGPMDQLWMLFSLSRQCYQVFPPLRIHCTPYSNCMCHASDSAYQGSNDLFEYRF